ncbi:MAG: protein phosphatase CheZ [Nitrospirota bacterium]|nr:protein phosphatase CheZ [Nitrospirota bacterium]
MLVDRNIEERIVEAPEEDHSINNELAELTKYVEVITSTIRDMESPVTTTSDQLPQATAHLQDLAKMTEDGAHQVLTLTERIETNRRTMQTALDQLQQQLGGEQATEVGRILQLMKEDERRLMDIHVALSFQDLVAQRVAKLVTILNEVQHKLLKLVVIFGIKQKKAGAAATDGGRGYEMLRQLEESKTTALQQDLVDDIMSEFGFS